MTDTVCPIASTSRRQRREQELLSPPILSSSCVPPWFNLSIYSILTLNMNQWLSLRFTESQRLSLIQIKIVYLSRWSKKVWFGLLPCGSLRCRSARLLKKWEIPSLNFKVAQVELSFNSNGKAVSDFNLDVRILPRWVSQPLISFPALRLCLSGT